MAIDILRNSNYNQHLGYFRRNDPKTRSLKTNFKLSSIEQLKGCNSFDWEGEHPKSITSSATVLIHKKGGATWRHFRATCLAPFYLQANGSDQPWIYHPTQDFFSPPPGSRSKLNPLKIFRTLVLKLIKFRFGVGFVPETTSNSKSPWKWMLGSDEISKKGWPVWRRELLLSVWL